MKNRMPQLVFGFLNNVRVELSCSTNFVSPVGIVPSDEDIHLQIRKERDDLEQYLQQAQGNVSSIKLQNYEREFREFLLALEPALYKSRDIDYGARCELGFTLSNTGTAHAEHIQISLNFPDGCHIFKSVRKRELEDDIANIIARPDRPLRPWQPPKISLPWMAGNFSLLDSSNLISQMMPFVSPILPGQFCGPKIRGLTARYNIPRLQHNDYWKAPLLPVILPRGNKGFSIACTIQADQLPEPVMKKLNVRQNEIRD